MTDRPSIDIRQPEGFKFPVHFYEDLKFIFYNVKV